MLKYTIFEQGYPQDPNKVRCPNCGSTHLKSNAYDSIYKCRVCQCRFLVETEFEASQPIEKPVNTYTLEI